ncbi:F-box/kelch-repeat protein At3g06240 [Ricinus communis]|uniref:F-box/kelch-repeat protein At3g06240 n=1 Tax=Ricinus communis TaxID=3988 RepID=UPI000772811D|nr:F-box/kelch-repeat protein At3g06240 [Ricinus communis]|eukprot:XP_015570816.1 F-box/kelch-repeat protein At3g06240 [Ricinus communis]
MLHLVRFRCVCKSWCALLSDPKFIYEKLLFSGEHQNYDNSPHPVVVKRQDISTRNYFFSVFSCDTFEISAPREIPYPKDIMMNMSDISIVGSSSNGFICLRDIYDPDIVLSNWKDCYETDCNMILWNPLTSEIKIIPKSNASRPPNTTYSRLLLVEFGFDRKSNDCKILKTFLVFHNGPQSDYFVEIYSLSNDSWRAVDVVVPFKFYSFDDRCHYTGANGEFHWWSKDENGQYQIVSFDLSDEKFKTSPLPDAIDTCFRFWTFFCLSEYVTMLLSSDCSFGVEFIDIWIMYEYGVKESWTKLFTVSSLPCVERPLGFWRNGELFMATWSGQLLLWNPGTETITEFQIDGVPESLQIVAFNGGPIPSKLRKKI